MSKLLLVDGNSIMNRAFYGTQDSFMKNSKGLFTGAVYGFLNIFYRYCKEEQPTHVAVAFDLKAPTFRHKMYDGYKATRKGMPPELAMQMPVIKDVLDAMGITRLEIEGFEADDIIGTYAYRAQEEGMECRILTGDRDSFQLITDKINVILPATGQAGTTTTIYTPQQIIDKYGVEPVKMLQVKSLMGDSSDNIPGVPGVGEKTALNLISQYGDLESIYEHIDEITKPALKKKLEENKELAFLSLVLAEIKKDVPLTEKIENMSVGQEDKVRLAELFTELEFSSFIKKFGLDGVEVQPQETREIPATEYMDTPDDFGKIPDYKKSGKMYLSCSFEGGQPKELMLMDEENNRVLATMMTSPFTAMEVLERIKPYLSDPAVKKYMYNAKPFILWLMDMGVWDFTGLEHDMALAAYVLDGVRKFNGFKDVYTFVMGTDLGDMPEVAAFAEMAEEVDKRIKADGLETLYRTVELPLVPVLASLEHYGFNVDPEVLKEEGRVMDARIKELTDAIYEYAGVEFNINSPKQLGEVLFGTLGLESKKKTKTGAMATNQEVLEELVDSHPIIPMIMEYRVNTKLKSTYIDGLQNAINPMDGKVHSSFNQTVTATGRLSSTEPNLQNIPVRHQLGRLIRKAFIPSKPGNVLIDADYSQIELRVMAAMSGDEAMMDAFKNEKDIHTITAAQINGVPEDMVTPEMRSSAKAVNFGIIYGISEFGLAKDVGISRFAAKKYIESYFDRYPGVKAFLDGMVASAKETGFASTMMGRRRYLPELTASKFPTRAFGERVAMNMPIQGTAADIIKIAMINVYNELKKQGLKAKLILQVHDELLIDAPEEEESFVVELLRKCMEEAYPLGVPLKVSVASGKTWYDAK